MARRENEKTSGPASGLDRIIAPLIAPYVNPESRRLDGAVALDALASINACALLGAGCEGGYGLSVPFAPKKIQRCVDVLSTLEELDAKPVHAPLHSTPAS